MACGDFVAINLAVSSASASGSSETLVASPSATASVPGDDPSGERELLGDVERDDLQHGLCDAHVGDQSPFDLHDRELRIGGDVAKVRAEGDLKPAAKGEAVDRGDDRDLDLLPDPARPLRHVGRALFAPRQELLHQNGRSHERPKIETCAKGLAFTVEHDRPNASCLR